MPAPALSAEVAALRELVLASVRDGSPVRLEGTDTFRNRLVPDDTPQEAAFDVVLVPSPVLAASTFFEVDGRPVPAPFVEAYAGHVDGRPDDLVRLTLAAAWARGTVRVADHSYRVAVGDLPGEEWTDGGEAGSGRPGGKASVPAGDPWSPDAAPGPSDGPLEVLTCFPDPVVGGERDPSSFRPVLERGRSREAPLTSRIVVESTPSTHARFGEHTFPLLVAAAQDLDLIYDHEVGVRMALAGLESRVEDDADSSGFAAMAERWNPRNGEVDRDLVFVIDHSFGRGLGLAAGQANCIGGAGDPNVAYAAVTVPDSLQLPFLGYMMAHEVGHLFNANHDDGNSVESHASTIMSYQFMVFGSSPVFGTLERSFIRGWAEAHI